MKRSLLALGAALLMAISPTIAEAKADREAPLPDGASLTRSELSRGATTSADDRAAVLNWRTYVGGGHITVTTGKNGTPIVGTDRTLEIRRPTNGSLVCRTPNYGRATTQPIIDLPRNRVFIGTTLGYVLNVNATTCRVNAINRTNTGPALVGYGNGVVAAVYPNHDTMHGYNADSLAYNWTYALSLPNAQEPRFISNGIILVANGPYLDAAATVDGSTLWYRTLSDQVVGRAAAPSDGRVYVTDASGNAYAFGVYDGSLVWSRNLGTTGQIIGSKALGKVFVSGANGRMYSLNSSTGNLNCFGVVGGSFNARAALDPITGATWGINTNGKTYKFSKGCGILWSYSTGSYPLSGPDHRQGQTMVYAAGGGYLYSFKK